MATAKINLSFYLFITTIFLLVNPGETSISNSSTQLPESNKPSDDPQKTSAISVKPLHTIDLATCKCLPKDAYCQIAIAKSVVMEIRCSEDLNYCCNSTATVQEESEGLKNPKIRIYIPAAIKPESSLETNNKNSSSKSNSNNQTETNLNEKLKPKCRCKPRNKCLSKYVDYRFGFDCSYSTVRCCEPESVILKEKEDALQESGKIILAGNKQALSHKSSDELLISNNKTSEDCFCLPISRCTVDPNTITKRKDTLCPYDLVQCCGESINSAKPEFERSTPASISSDGNSTGSTKSEARVGTTGSGIGVIMHGQPAFWQPVQLPLMKIPLRSQEDSQAETVNTSTLPPPQLPSHYYYQPPSYQMEYYNPSSQSQYVNSPWTSLTHTSPYHTNQYSRYRPGQAEIQPSVQYESARSNEGSPNFLKTIANFLG